MNSNDFEQNLKEFFTDMGLELPDTDRTIEVKTGKNTEKNTDTNSFDSFSNNSNIRDTYSNYSISDYKELNEKYSELKAEYEKLKTDKEELERKNKYLRHDSKKAIKELKNLREENIELKDKRRNMIENLSLQEIFWSIHYYFNSISTVYDSYKLKILEDLKELLEKQNKPEFNRIDYLIDTDIKLQEGKIQYINEWYRFFRDHNVPISIYEYTSNDPFLNIGNFRLPKDYLKDVDNNYRFYCIEFDKLKKSGKVKDSDKLTKTEYLDCWLNEFRYMNEYSELYDPDFKFEEWVKSIKVFWY